MRYSSRLSLWVWIVLLGGLFALMQSCGGGRPKAPAEVGRLEMSLAAASNSGTRYRLRSATFDVSGASQTSLSSEDGIDDESIGVDLGVGDYQVRLADGWHLERADSNGTYWQLDATLVSDNPAAFTIKSEQTTSVHFRFRAGDEVVENGPGHLIIDMIVEDSVTDGGPLSEVREIAALPPTDGTRIVEIQGLQVLASSRTTMLIGTQNEAAYCGGGTPATIWRLTLDPTTGLATDYAVQQSLDQIQNIRYSLFESSDGTLFTGGGWCGFKPPYYSTDQGETFVPADTGVFPPNSSFSYVEFHDHVYVGTGYEPYNGEVYRWEGGGSWTRVLSIPPPRSIVDSMVAFQDRLYVSSSIYGWGGAGCETSVPVYVSADGTNFAATQGLPPCQSTVALAVTGPRMFAITGDASIYGFDPAQNTWALIGPFPFRDLHKRITLGYSGKIYVEGVLSSTSVRGIYRSADGIAWDLVARVAGPETGIMTVENDTLYITSQADSAGIAHIYAVQLTNE